MATTHAHTQSSPFALFALCLLGACGEDTGSEPDASRTADAAVEPMSDIATDAAAPDAMPPDAAEPDEEDAAEAPSFEPGSPTFAAIYHEIIVGTGCNGGPLCHGGAVGALQMNDPAATYEALVGVPAMGTNLADAMNADCVDTGLVRVVPGDPDNSLLVQKIDPPGGVVPCGAAMPPTGALEPAHIEQIRTWIEGGAADD